MGNSRAGWSLWSGRVLNFGFLRGCNESSVNYDRTPSCDYISNERSGVPYGMRSLSLGGRHNNTMAKSWRRLFARRRRAQDMRPQDKKNNEFAGAYSCPVLEWNDVYCILAARINVLGHCQINIISFSNNLLSILSCTQNVYAISNVSTFHSKIEGCTTITVMYYNNILFVILLVCVYIHIYIYILRMYILIITMLYLWSSA